MRSIGFIGVMDTRCLTRLSLAGWAAMCQANVAPSGRNFNLLPYPCCGARLFLSFSLLSKRQKQKHGIRPNSYLKSTFSAEKQSNLGRQFSTAAGEKCIFQQLASFDFYITGLCMVRPLGPNLADLPFDCREAAEALKA